MGKAFKIILIIAIICSIAIFSVSSIYINTGINARIKSIENQLLVIDKRREYYSQQVISLQAVKDNLENSIAMQTDKVQQQALQDQAIALSAEQKLAAEQQAAAEQARLDALRAQQLAQAQQASKTVKTVTSTTTRTRTRAS